MKRRDFLGAAASIATARPAMPADTAAYRIDCQSHLYVPELLALMENRQISPRVYRQGADRYVVVNQWVRRVLPKHMDVDAKLADMDAAGIRTTMLSINDPGPELFGADGPKIARLAHDFMAGIMRAHSSRFIGLATLPLQDMDASLVELARCVNKLGFRGILLYSNLDGKWPDEPRFRSLFSRAAEIGVPVLLLHPRLVKTPAGPAEWRIAGSRRGLS
jgi:predicted TIM-barrel fold metal-dependent hydrolase